MTDPEEPTTIDHDELAERPADLADELSRPLPDDANEADVIEQKLAVPDSDEDDYPG